MKRKFGKAKTKVFLITVFLTFIFNCKSYSQCNVNPIAGNSKIICKNESAQLNASGGLTYNWTPSSSLSNSNISNPIATPNITTTYWLTATDSNGCTGTNSVVITVSPNPKPIVNAGSDATICFNSGIKLNVTGNGTSYNWSNGMTSTSILVQPFINSTYSVTATEVGGCTNSDEVVVKVNSLCQGQNKVGSIVKGNVFFDFNKNGKKDSSEKTLNNFMIKIMPDNIFINTDINGNYAVMLDTGKHYIEPVFSNKYFVSKPLKDSCNIKTYGIIDSLHNFMFKTIKDTVIFNAEFTNVTIARPGFDLFFDINFRNEGTFCLTKGMIRMKYDTTKMTYISSIPNRDMVSIDTLMWNFNSLCPFQTSVVKAKFKVNPKTPIGTKLKIAYSMNADTTLNKSARLQFSKCDTLELLVVGSYDPNDKEVSPAGDANGNVPNLTDELTYTIRFQNTGTDTAFFVYIKDTLSKNLDISTFREIASSHPNTYTIEKNEITFRFLNILLPDSNKNKEASNGFVKYSISPKANLPQGTTIENNAYIYFDYNAPVKTNTTRTILKDIVSVRDVLLPDNIGIIYPNPAQNELKVNVGAYHDTPVSYKIYDIMGKVIIKREFGENKQVQYNSISTGSMTVDISKLTKGIYIIELRTENNVLRQKFVKE